METDERDYPAEGAEGTNMATNFKQADWIKLISVFRSAVLRKLRSFIVFEKAIEGAPVGGGGNDESRRRRPERGRLSVPKDRTGCENNANCVRTHAGLNGYIIFTIVHTHAQVGC